MEFEELFDLMNRCKVLQEELNQIKENLEKGLFKNIVYDDCCSINSAGRVHPLQG